MALGRSKSFQISRRSPVEGDLEIVASTRIIGRKRIVVSNWLDASDMASPWHTPLQKRHNRRMHSVGLNCLESLPQDILVRILCKVNHGDLRQLLLVSKHVKEATLIAREMHFVYSTPSSKQFFTRGSEDSDEAPDAPMRRRVAKSRIDDKSLASVAVALFATTDE